MTDGEVGIGSLILLGMAVLALHVEGYTVNTGVVVLAVLALLLVWLVLAAVRVATDDDDFLLR